MLKKVVFTVIGLITAFTFFSCDEVSGPKGGKDDPDRADTSKFIGTWIQIFDTLSPGGKESWSFSSGFFKPDTMIFINDSVYTRANLKDDYFYYYTSDTLYRYTEEGLITKSDTLARWYGLKNDTLFLDTLFDVYNKFYIRIKK